MEKFASRLHFKEEELRGELKSEMESNIEKERSKFFARLELIKANMKCEYEKILKVKFLSRLSFLTPKRECGFFFN